MAFFNGLDSTKEMAYGSGIASELACRGISTLIVDHHGTLLPHSESSQFLILIARFVNIDAWFLVASHPCTT